MADGYEKKRPYGKTAVLGVAAVALYSALLLNQEFINNYFGNGGIYAILPIITAFIFSFIHGTFTGNFWTMLGIEAKKKREGK
ncbi:MAG: hypothetical protein AABY79_01565 [Nitrospirota bacterium]